MSNEELWAEYMRAAVALTREHGIQSTLNMRRNAEQRYALCARRLRERGIVPPIKKKYLTV